MGRRKYRAITPSQQGTVLSGYRSRNGHMYKFFTSVMSRYLILTCIPVFRILERPHLQSAGRGDLYVLLCTKDGFGKHIFAVTAPRVRLEPCIRSYHSIVLPIQLLSFNLQGDWIRYSLLEPMWHDHCSVVKCWEEPVSTVDIADVTIPLVDTIESLGETADTGLSFDKRVNQICQASYLSTSELYGGCEVHCRPTSPSRSPAPSSTLGSTIATEFCTAYQTIASQNCSAVRTLWLELSQVPEREKTLRQCYRNFTGCLFQPELNIRSPRSRRTLSRRIFPSICLSQFGANNFFAESSLYWNLFTQCS